MATLPDEVLGAEQPRNRRFGRNDRSGVSTDAHGREDGLLVPDVASLANVNPETDIPLKGLQSLYRWALRVRSVCCGFAAARLVPELAYRAVLVQSVRVH